MKDFVQLVEFVSIDIALIGFLVLYILALAVESYRHSSWSIWRTNVVILERLQNWRRNGKNSDHEKAGSYLIVIGLVLVASALGTIFSVIADEVLDSPKIESEVYFYVPELKDWDELKNWGIPIITTYGDRDKWKEEDTIKVDVLFKVNRRKQLKNTKLDAVFRRHLPCGKESSPDKCTPGEWQKLKSNGETVCGDTFWDDCPKGLFQHASAFVTEKASGATKNRVRRERYAVELLSVVFVGIWIVLLAKVFGLFKGSLRERWFWFKGIGWPRRGKVMLTFILTVLGLWIAEGVAIRLWTEQLKGYDHTLLSSYATVASFGDPAMGIPAPVGM